MLELQVQHFEIFCAVYKSSEAVHITLLTHDDFINSFKAGI